MNKIKQIQGKYHSMPVQVKASLWFTICNVLNKGIALLATPIFTRIMTTEEYGQFTVYQSWNALLFIFTSLNLFMGGYERGLIEFEHDQKRLTSSLYGLSALITLFFLGLYLIFRDWWTGFSHLPPFLMVPMFLELFTMPAYDFWLTKKRFSYEYKAPVMISLLLSATSVILGAVLVMNTQHRLIARVYSNTFVILVLAGFIALLIIKQGKCLYHRKYWRYALRFNLPLIPHFLSTMVLNQADRIMIQDLVSSSAAGIYGVAHSVGMLVLLVVNGVNNSYTPYFFRALKDGNYENIKKSSVDLVALMGVLTVLSMVFTPEIIYIFAGNKYYDAVHVLPPLALSVFFIFVYSVFSQIEYYFGRTAFLSLASIFCAVLNIVLNAIFIRMYGYYAAGYTTLTCYIFFALVHMLFCMKILKDEKIEMHKVFDFKKLLIISIGALFMMFMMLCIYDYMIIRYAVFMIICVFGWIKRNKIIEILNFKKKN